MACFGVDCGRCGGPESKAGTLHATVQSRLPAGALFRATPCQQQRGWAGDLLDRTPMFWVGPGTPGTRTRRGVDSDGLDRLYPSFKFRSFSSRCTWCRMFRVFDVFSPSPPLAAAVAAGQPAEPPPSPPTPTFGGGIMRIIEKIIAIIVKSCKMIAYNRYSVGTFDSNGSVPDAS